MRASRRTARAARHVVLFVVILVAVAGVSLYTVLTLGNALPFRTVAQSDRRLDFGIQAYTSPQPGLFVVTTPNEAKDLSTNLLAQDPELLAQLLSVDYNAELVILAFHGYAPSDGYSVTVQRVQRRGTSVFVRASFAGPAPGELIHPAFSSPYHLIAVSKVGIWRGQIRFVLVSGAEQVAETSRFFP